MASNTDEHSSISAVLHTARASVVSHLDESESESAPKDTQHEIPKESLSSLLPPTKTVQSTLNVVNVIKNEDNDGLINDENELENSVSQSNEEIIQSSSDNVNQQLDISQSASLVASTDRHGDSQTLSEIHSSNHSERVNATEVSENQNGRDELPPTEAVTNSANSNTQYLDYSRGFVDTNNVGIVREHLFHVLFQRTVLAYALTVSPRVRRLIEFFLLLKALLAFLLLMYLHFAFNRVSMTSFNLFPPHNHSYDIIRLEVLNDIPDNYSIYQSYANEYGQDRLPKDLTALDSFNVSSPSFVNISFKDVLLSGFRPSQLKFCPSTMLNSTSICGLYDNLLAFPDKSLHINISDQGQSFWNKLSIFLFGTLFSGMEDEKEPRYIMEYAHDFDLLRLLPRTRRRFNVSVKFVALDPWKNDCFGNYFTRLLLDEFFGYDDFILASFKTYAEQAKEKGFVRNVMSGEKYHFVEMWVPRFSYVTAAATMLVFTIAVSMLLRYSHHLIFIFIVELLHMIGMNTFTIFPILPLLTVILALVGMEAIMSEFFSDSATTFYVILIVWIADQFDLICCHTSTTRKHWQRFFFLYHLGFYAYHYRFNGQFGSMALICSWFCIQHSMVYFLHHYEITAILEQHRREVGLRVTAQPTNSQSPDAHFDSQTSLDV